MVGCKGRFQPYLEHLCKSFSVLACPPRSLAFCGGFLASYSLGEGEMRQLLPRLVLFVAGLQFEFINPIFEFSKGMNELQLNDAEYALLIAINIFSAGKKQGRSEELQQ